MTGFLPNLGFCLEFLLLGHILRIAPLFLLETLSQFLPSCNFLRSGSFSLSKVFFQFSFQDFSGVPSGIYESFSFDFYQISSRDFYTSVSRGLCKSSSRDLFLEFSRYASQSFPLTSFQNCAKAPSGIPLSCFPGWGFNGISRIFFRE